MNERFEVNRRAIVEYDTDVASKYLPGMLYADLLYKFPLATVQFVHVVVYLIQTVVFCKMTSQIVYRSHFALWLAYP